MKVLAESADRTSEVDVGLSVAAAVGMSRGAERELNMARRLKTEETEVRRELRRMSIVREQ
jgi:hypothetical protein